MAARRQVAPISRVSSSPASPLARLQSALFGAASLVVIATLVGLASNALLSRPLPVLKPYVPADTFRTIDLASARAMHGTALFLDARSTREYAAGHIPGALSLPAGKFDAKVPSLRDAIGKAPRVVVYCEGVDCDASLRLARRLQEAGRRELYVFRAGVAAWDEAGLPLTQGEAP